MFACELAGPEPAEGFDPEKLDEFCEALLTGDGPDWLGTAGTPGLEGLEGFEEDEDSDIGLDLDTSGDRTR